MRKRATGPVPPWVPCCDFDINKLGRQRVVDWMAEQRAQIPASAELGNISRDAISDPSLCMPPPPPRKPSVSKRKFRGHGWSKSGSKETRRRRKLILEPPPPAPSLEPVQVCVPASSSSKSTPPELHQGADRANARGVRMRHPLDEMGSTPTSVSVRDTTDHAGVSPFFCHPTGLAMDAHMRRARSVYAYVHTVLHYPQVLSVRLYGEPAVMSDGSSSPHRTVGDQHAGHAISETIRAISDFDVNPKSLCNHKGCIYNQGDAVARRRRHQLAIANLNALLERNSRVPTAAPSPTPSPQSSARNSSADALITSRSASHRTVLDSGASRHLERLRALLSGVPSKGSMVNRPRFWSRVLSTIVTMCFMPLMRQHPSVP